jgi:hypothetical protein
MPSGKRRANADSLTAGAEPAANLDTGAVGRPAAASTFIALPHNSSEIVLPKKIVLGAVLYEEPVAFNPEVAPLLCSVPLFIPRHFDFRDEIISLDSISLAICRHRLEA